MTGQRRVAVVTGASRGIGRAIAVRLAAEGHDVVLVARDAAALGITASAVTSLGTRAVPMACDLERLDEVAGVIPQVMDILGRVDVLVNNAGLFVNGSVATLEPAMLERVLRVNTVTPALLCRAAAEHMAPQRYGRIVNIASVAGLRGVPHAAAYAMSKAALVSLTRCLAIECGRRGITVNCVAPGMIDTPMTDEFRADDDRRGWALGLSAMRRWGRVEEVADAVAHFASEAAAFTTGQVLAVDGGWTAA